MKKYIFQIKIYQNYSIQLFYYLIKKFEDYYHANQTIKEFDNDTGKLKRHQLFYF